jgi:hypothetical protein
VSDAKPYVIWAPDYRNQSSGIRVLYSLGNLLRKRGFQAEMKMTHGPYRENPFDVPECVTVPENAIHVYPEIVTGNPSDSSRVVWWLLNHAERDGLKFVWNPSIGPWPVLNVPYIEPEVFYPGDGPRSGVVVWGGKNGVSYVPEGATTIGYGWPSSRTELADLLRRSEYLLSFDVYSALVHEATLCGCPVVVDDDGQWSLEKANAGDLKVWGVVDHESKLDIARDEVRVAFERYLESLNVMDQHLDVFVEITQKL